MENALTYPFDSKMIRRKKKAIRRKLLDNLSSNYQEKKIAILGGSTTTDIKDILELFLLQYQIMPVFYESEYGRYWEDAIFGNDELDSFSPDIIYIHTSIHNIISFPEVDDNENTVNNKLHTEYDRFVTMWENLKKKFQCPIIQNNFEYPIYRILGNLEASDYRGRVNYVTRINMLFYSYAQKVNYLFINDINYQSSDFGLKNWSDPFYWHMYKYSLSLDAIPLLAFNVSNIIKAIFGKNKKAIAVDLDNTLWGGVIGDDGVDNILIGQETSEGQVYHAFQKYLKELSRTGILLNIVSKNEYENAVSGLEHPASVLAKEDFICIKANWEPKNINLQNICKEIDLLPESFVFIDDNPAERQIIREYLPGVGIPEIDKAENYIIEIDRNGYFESVGLSKSDLSRNIMYKENIERKKEITKFTDYKDYLLSLKMHAVISPFESVYYARIAQLTNKSNQFNLTTRRYSLTDIEKISTDENYITLYGQLFDKFGDNGIVSLVIGDINGSELNIVLWLMSCRVLKRDMEYAMMDILVHRCKEKGITTINGVYIPSGKNKMVQYFYKTQGFSFVNEKDGTSFWTLNVKEYINKNMVIEIDKE